MTKQHYMALADVQDLWTNKQKPWINEQKADKSSTYTKTEVDTLLENNEPYFDEANHRIVCP